VSGGRCRLMDGSNRRWSRCCLPPVTVSALEVSRDAAVVGRLRWRIQSGRATRYAFEFDGHAEQPGNLIPTQQCMRAALVVASHRRATGIHPKGPARQFALDNALCAYTWQPVQVDVGIGREVIKLAPIDLS